VVDDGSSDDSARVAEEASVRVLKTGEQRGPAYARNLGARHARGEILLFLDADVCVHRDTLGRIARAFANDSGLAAIMGSYDDAPGDCGFCSQYRNLMHCFVHQMGRRQAITFWTGCGAVRKRVFDELNGFDERHTCPSAEDIEFGYRMTVAGCKVILDRSVLVKHLKKWTLGMMLKTDVMGRGVPWTRLILRYRKMPNDLNLRWSQRWSVVMAWTAPAVLALAAASGLLTGANALLVAIGTSACFLSVVLMNLGFYLFLAERRGIGFALAAVPVHWCFHFLNGISFLIGLTLHSSSLTRMFLGRFRQIIHAETELLELEANLAKAADPVECWTKIQAGGRKFGFDGARMMLAGTLFHDSRPGNSGPTWQLRIALSETDHVNFSRDLDAAACSGSDPLILSAFVRSVERGLRQNMRKHNAETVATQASEMRYVARA
jgi:hypothetical protein